MAYEFTANSSGIPNLPNQGQNGRFDDWLRRAADAVNVYNGVRCAVRPTAPGCNQGLPGGGGGQPPPAKDYTGLIIGVTVLLIVFVLILVFALKKK